MNKNNHKNLRHTKIVATLGPATDDPQVMLDLLSAGVNVVRINFSHGTHEEQGRRIDLVRDCAEKLGLIVGVLADLQGPKIRVASFAEGKITLKEGDEFILDAGLAENDGNQATVGIDYKDLPKDVENDDILLLDDGRIKLSVTKIKGKKVICQVLVGGVLSDHKGINRQGGGLTAKALTEKDLKDMEYALQKKADYLAISFPRDANDMREARQWMEKFKGDAGIIAKIERTEAVHNVDEIIAASDGVMVARGDLAVEIGDGEVPVVQKHIIQRARSLDKPVITATQMMESMIASTVPTRAEVSDVANAVLDYTDAVMLSAETAVGINPVHVVEAMSRACLAAEKYPLAKVSKHRVECTFNRADEAIAMATMYTANHFPITAIIALTESGATALLMSRIRTGMSIFGLSRHTKTLNRMALYRGVMPIYFDVTKFTREQVNAEAIATLEKHYELQKGDQVILTKGDHLGVGGGANVMKVLEVGKIA